MAEHETISKSDEWYTPAWIFEALDVSFAVDVASPGAWAVPWVTAVRHITANSLTETWKGPVWMNPPFGKRNGIRPWLDKFADHGNGIAIVPNRTATDWFQSFAKNADGLLFIRGKVKFIRPDGSKGKSPGYGNVLVAYGKNMSDALHQSKIEGLRFNVA